MDELHVAAVNIGDETHVCDLAATLAGGEEHEVTRLKVFLFYFLTNGRLIFGRPRKRKVDRLVSMYRERRTIYTRAGCTTILIRSAHEGLCGAYDLLDLLCADLRLMRGTTRR